MFNFYNTVSYLQLLIQLKVCLPELDHLQGACNVSKYLTLEFVGGKITLYLLLIQDTISGVISNTYIKTKPTSGTILIRFGVTHN